MNDLSPGSATMEREVRSAPAPDGRSRRVRTRGFPRKLIDFVTFPVRAVTLFHKDWCGLSSLASERFGAVAQETKGYCLDIGCGPYNRFIAEFLGGHGLGIDVFEYAGLTAEQLVPDLTQLPFADGSFGTVTFIGNINHCPRDLRDPELREAYRVLEPGGRIVVTMGNPVTEVLVHKVVWLYDRLFGTKVDLDTQRGMVDGEDYFLTDREIRGRLVKAGFRDVRKKYIVTEWCLNHLFVGIK